MDALFCEDLSSSLFAVARPPKCFYHPGTPSSKHAQGILQVEVKGTALQHSHHHPPAHCQDTCQHLSSWDIKHCPSIPSGVAHDQLRHNTVDISPGGSPIFNESWPSHSEEGDSVAKVEDESTLARYIERFRQAPPTDRASRDVPNRPFWWKHPGKTTPTLPLEEQSAASTELEDKDKGITMVSGHTHTDPSLQVSSLDSRCHELIEKSSSLFNSSSSDSPPAQKYLNTMNRPKPPPTTGNGHIACLLPSEDILTQWRLQRKLERARVDSTVPRHLKCLCEPYHKPEKVVGEEKGEKQPYREGEERYCMQEKVVMRQDQQVQTEEERFCAEEKVVRRQDQQVQTKEKMDGDKMVKQVEVGNERSRLTADVEQLDVMTSLEDITHPKMNGFVTCSTPQSPPKSHLSSHNGLTHGGLALRDAGSEETLLTLTFDKTENCTSPSNSRRHFAPPLHREPSQDSLDSNQDIDPSKWQDFPAQVLRSKEKLAPLQKADSVECAPSGFPWDYDMDDQLLKLLISKARHFEAQIREIDGWLMELQDQEQ